MKIATSRAGVGVQAWLIAIAISLVPVSRPAAQAEADGSVAGSTDSTRICESRSTVLEQLSNRFSEAPVAMGLATNGSVLELLSSGEGSSWTIILTGADGISCVIATGESWQVRNRVDLHNDIDS
ncbi:MAG: hypothetical protein P1U65_07445 [Minwuia sp.]|nr:hypothetical protein [Minwuia sp.]